MSLAGTIRATVLIETLPAAFEMDEILFRAEGPLGRLELRPVGLHFQLSSRNFSYREDLALA